MTREPERDGQTIIRQTADGTWRAWSWTIAWGRRGFATREAAARWAIYAPAVLGMCRGLA